MNLKSGMIALTLALTIALTACAARTPASLEEQPSQAPADALAALETPTPEAEDPAPETDVSALETEPPASEPSVSQGQPSDPETEGAENLPELLEQAGMTLSDITAGQLIVIRADGNTARAYGFERTAAGEWRTVIPATDGHVGKNGVTADKREGDGKMPKGLFTLTTAFGIQPDPGSGLP